MRGLVPGEDVLWELLALHAAPAAGGQAELRGQQLRHHLHGRHLAVPVQGEPAARDAEYWYTVVENNILLALKESFARKASAR